MLKLGIRPSPVRLVRYIEAFAHFSSAHVAVLCHESSSVLVSKRLPAMQARGSPRQEAEDQGAGAPHPELGGPATWRCMPRLDDRGLALGGTPRGSSGVFTVIVEEFERN